MLSTRFNRWTIAALTIAALAAPGAVLAQTPEHTGDNSAQFPSKADLKGLTTAGSYLAARHASVERDANSGRRVLPLGAAHRPEEQRAARPRLHLLAGGWRQSTRRSKLGRPHPDAGQVQPCRPPGGRCPRPQAEEIRHRADQHHPVDPWTDHRPGGDAAVGWATYGAGDAKTAVANIDKLTGPEWYPIFKDLHAGMILELANKEKDAGSRFERAYKLDDSMLRVSDAYARWLSRNKDRRRRPAIYEVFDKKLPRHPLVQESMRELKAGKKLPPLIETAQAGCGRSPVRHRCDADPPRRRGPGAGLSPARAFTSSPITRWRCCRSPISMSR